VTRKTISPDLGLVSRQQLHDVMAHELEVSERDKEPCDRRRDTPGEVATMDHYVCRVRGSMMRRVLSELVGTNRSGARPRDLDVYEPRRLTAP
jgi:hypothetical protein